MIEKKRVKSRRKVKLLGVTIDDKLSFTTHIENLCSTASKLLWALARIHKFVSFKQAKRLSEAYIMSTFTYCPLIWMFCSKTANKINKRSLRVIYEMKDADFEDLLIKDNSWTIHENNIHTLLIEIYKFLNHISPAIMQEFFYLKVTLYSLRKNNPHSFYYKNEQNWTLGLPFLKFSWFLGYIVLNLFLFFLDFF